MDRRSISFWEWYFITKASVNSSEPQPAIEETKCVHRPVPSRKTQMWLIDSAAGSSKAALVSSICWIFVCRSLPATQQPNITSKLSKYLVLGLGVGIVGSVQAFAGRGCVQYLLPCLRWSIHTNITLTTPEATDYYLLRFEAKYKPCHSLKVQVPLAGDSPRSLSYPIV